MFKIKLIHFFIQNKWKACLHLHGEDDSHFSATFSYISAMYTVRNIFHIFPFFYVSALMWIIEGQDTIGDFIRCE